MNMRQLRTRFAPCLLFCLFALCLAACGQATPGNDGRDKEDDDPKGGTPPPSPVHDTIAYVVASGPSAGDEIRLIDPDGGRDRLLWRSDQDDVLGVHSVGSLSWNPQATALAFSSTHENWCSLFGSDIFTIGSDGSQYRRLTQAPACGDLSTYPKGGVQVPVKNLGGDSFSGFMYFQGAASVKPVNLPPNGATVVVFEDVADFGSGQDWLQAASLISGTRRQLLISTFVDVQAGGSVSTAEAAVWPPDSSWNALDPTWRSDAQAVTFRLNNSDLLELPVQPHALEFGQPVLAQDRSLPDFITHLARGPGEDRASQILYVGTYIFDQPGVFLLEKGSSGPGEQLVTFDSLETIQGLTWLPDGSGFLFSHSEGELLSGERASNLFRYDFVGPQVVRLTDYTRRFVGRLSVSGDGSTVVYELGADIDALSGEVVDPDLYVLEIGSAKATAALLVEDARAPAWSW